MCYLIKTATCAHARQRCACARAPSGRPSPVNHPLEGVKPTSAPASPMSTRGYLMVGFVLYYENSHVCSCPPALRLRPRALWSPSGQIYSQPLFLLCSQVLHAAHAHFRATQGRARALLAAVHALASARPSAGHSPSRRYVVREPLTLTIRAAAHRCPCARDGGSLRAPLACPRLTGA